MSNGRKYNARNVGQCVSVKDRIVEELTQLTKAQKFCDWFILRLFGVTGQINPTKILLNKYAIILVLDFQQTDTLSTKSIS